MTPRERLFALEQFGIKLGLDNIHRILDALGPARARLAGVHVAGTNGKGSVTAMVERGLRAAGHTHRAIHLAASRAHRRADRHRRRPVEPGAFRRSGGGRALRRRSAARRRRARVEADVFRGHDRDGVRDLPHVTRRRPRWSRWGSAGGSTRPTSLTPVASAITSIAFDHERHLGTTLDAIAFEKAGIIKPADASHCRCELPSAAREVIDKRAAEVQAPVVAADRRRSM